MQSAAKDTDPSDHCPALGERFATRGDPIVAGAWGGSGATVNLRAVSFVATAPKMSLCVAGCPSPTSPTGVDSRDFCGDIGKGRYVIPQSARARLREAAPAPKTVIAFGGDHMGVGSNKMSLLQAIIAASTTWLIKKVAVNPT